MTRRPLVLAWLAAVLAACGDDAGGRPLPAISAPHTIRVTSPGFRDGARLPVQHTCDGAGVAPRLSWSEEGRVEEFVLVATDPDAPGGAFAHWVVYAIPFNADSIGEGQGPSGSRQGRNDLGRIGYAAACPPPGDDAHRYVFTLYGLSRAATARLPRGATAAEMLDAIRCCVRSMGTLTGTYER